MLKLLRRWWNYLTAKSNAEFNARADPKVQLEQAITEAQDQHRRLKEHAANVIAQQHLTEQQLDRQLGQLEKLNGNARQAVKMADDAAKKGDTAKATEYTRAAETIATQLISVESQIADLKEQHYAATQAADQAKAAVATNGQVLQQKLAEKQKLLSQLEQAKMQEQMNKAMASLSETVGQEVPTLNEVRDKIEQRYAKAKGMSELQETSVETRMVEIEAASQNFEAQARLDEIRSQLGIEPAVAPEAAAAPAAPEVAEATATEPPSEPQASPGV